LPPFSLWGSKELEFAKILFMQMLIRIRTLKGFGYIEITNKIGSLEVIIDSDPPIVTAFRTLDQEIDKDRVEGNTITLQQALGGFELEQLFYTIMRDTLQWDVPNFDETLIEPGVRFEFMYEGDTAELKIEVWDLDEKWETFFDVEYDFLDEELIQKVKKAYSTTFGRHFEAWRIARSWLNWLEDPTKKFVII
jgi:hypothetical protein